MGTKIPTGENPLIHPAISLTLLVAWIVATIATITSLCVSRLRRKPSPSPSPSPSASSHKTTDKSEIETPPTTTSVIPPLPPQTSSTTVHLVEKTEKQLPQIQEPLKLPPMRHLRESSSYNFMPNSTTTKPKLVMSMSMKVSRSMSTVGKLQARKEEQQQRKEDKLKSEDSIWMKTIILGERCRVPEEDDTIIYDDKGHRISTYHPKTPRSLPVSRTNSFIDPSAISTLRENNGN